MLLIEEHNKEKGDCFQVGGDSHSLFFRNHRSVNSPQGTADRLEPD